MIEVTPTTTLFYPLFEYGAKPEPDEMRAARRINTAGALEKLAVYVSSNTLEGNAVIRSRVNSVYGQLVIMVSPLETGLFETLSDADIVQPGDYVVCAVSYAGPGTIGIDNIDALFTPHALPDRQLTHPRIKRHEVDPLISACAQATTPHHKGKRFEDLIEYLFGRIQGLQIVYRDVRTETEEIDFVLENTDGSSPFPKAGPLILVECKNWSGQCGMNELVAFQQKIRNRRGTCTVAFLISWNGFTATSYTEQLRGS